MSTGDLDLVVVGGGVIGMSIAWKVASAGLSVVVCDPVAGQGASWAAAGMLAPTTEARWGEEALHALAQESMALWPSFARQLEEETGVEVGLSSEGTLSVAFDADDLRALSEAVEVQREFGCKSELLTGRECRRLEPSLNPRVVGGALQPDDHQVDNRALFNALLRAAQGRGAEVLPVAVRHLLRGPDGEVTGVLLDDGDELCSTTVVLAAGSSSGQVGGLLEADLPPVRPVKGQILRLGPSSLGSGANLPRRNIRALAQGRYVYLVPRRDGELVVGATVEEKGFDTTVTVGAVYDLIRAAVTVVPDVAEMELSEVVARSRPGTPDNGPLLGPAASDGLFIATGHFRHGILLAPVTTSALLESLAGRPLPGAAAAFSATRFAVVAEERPSA